ncbi:hypothetical protein GCM10023085_43140 [Actinomadura viridis]|uniref:EfeO-type cupredoxin-like domain-containing protein n=1 Tax=Actinomadura viridis TaxID=58110 RepID=A0A931GNM2_9ACTN|nr:hypothetical protein [Actinomadura viridis]MBG6089676.1 hypothetical protein [Actinomadura viridis]
MAGAVSLAAVLAAASGCGEPAPTGSPAGSPTGSPGAASTSPPAAPETAAVTDVTVTVVNGKPRTGPGRVKVRRGATVRITVTSDTADEFHLHGYDRTLPLAPGRPATLRLVAATPGVFEAELHHSGARLFELQVG